MSYLNKMQRKRTMIRMRECAGNLATIDLAIIVTINEALLTMISLIPVTQVVCIYVCVLGIVYETNVFIFM